MIRGKIKKLVEDKGFGFITPVVNGKDIFFHCSVVHGAEFEDLEPGQMVDYELGKTEEGGKGPKAVKVCLV